MRRVLTVAAFGAAVLVGFVLGHGSSQDPAAAETPAVKVHLVDRTIVVVDRTKGTWAGLRAAVDGWSQSRWVDLVVRPVCDPTRYCIVIQEPMYHDTTWIGESEYLTKQVGIVRLNTDGWWKKPAYVESGGMEEQSTLAHEIGHLIGLQHPPKSVDPTTTCMAIKGVPSPVVTELDLANVTELHQVGARERSALRFIYPGSA